MLKSELEAENAYLQRRVHQLETDYQTTRRDLARYRGIAEAAVPAIEYLNRALAASMALWLASSRAS